MSDQSMQPVISPTSQPTPGEQTQPVGGGNELAAVLIHNDDVTPFEYVIGILGALFLLSEEIAEHVAWTAHSKGSAVVVVRPRPEAEKLVLAACGRSQREGFPLTFTLGQG
jgi:ATP-dependent Clp protease adaptor protein ClpS